MALRYVVKKRMIGFGKEKTEVCSTEFYYQYG